ncbi:MAG: tRNA lysidine(34) synthetase TilS [Burkholderiales bacterium]|nr:tRNA lysidine(34) synthetase TilS [Burkholderiales bacterium]
MAVAFSGGRDSTALLHATLAAAEPLGLKVIALHVHHGLNAAADRWLAHGEALCRRWARRGRPVEFVATRVAGRPGPGESVEAWARQARYRALRAMALARGIDLVLLAHHRRDQAETFLLQALRGGGVAGLAAMPVQVRREAVTWARPWLEMPREAIDAYVRRHRLAHIEDDSNADPRFARNRLRLRLWPALVDTFPEAEAALAGAARWAQEAAVALAEGAEVDLAAAADEASLDIAAWRALSAARQGNVLRAWLRRMSGRAAPASLVRRLLREVPAKGSMRWPAGDGELRSYRGRLRYEPATEPAAAKALPSRSAPTGSPLDLGRPGIHELAEWGGAIEVRRVVSDGLPVALAACLTPRARAPGDRFQAGAGRPPRSLKLQFQAAGVPAWERRGPVFCADGLTVFVPGLGIDARARAVAGEPQVSLAWHARR